MLPILLGFVSPTLVLIGLFALLVGLSLGVLSRSSHRRLCSSLEAECSELESQLAQHQQLLVERHEGPRAEVGTWRQQFEEAQAARLEAEEQAQQSWQALEQQTAALEEAERAALQAEQRLEEETHRRLALDRKLQERPLPDPDAQGDSAEKLLEAQSENQHLKQQLTEAEILRDESQQALLFERTLREAAGEQIADLTAARQQKDSRITLLEEQLRLAGEQAQQARLEASDVREQFTQLQSQQARDAESWRSWRLQLDDLLRTQRRLARRRRLDLLSSERRQARMGGRIGRLRRERVQLKLQLQRHDCQHQTQRQRWRAQHDQLQQRLATLETQLAATRSERRMLEATLREAADRMRHLTRDRDAARQSQSESEQQLAENQKRCEHLHVQLREARASGESSLEQESRLRQALELAEQTSRQQAADLQALRSSQEQSRSSESHALEVLAQRHEAQMQAVAQQELRLERERRDALTTMLKRTEQDLLSTRSQYQREREEWDQQTAEIACRLQNRSESLERSQQLCESLQRSVDDLQDQLRDSQRQFAEQGLLLEEATAQHERSQRELQQALLQGAAAQQPWEEQCRELRQQLLLRNEAEMEAARRLRLLRQQFEDQQDRLDQAEAERDAASQQCEHQRDRFQATRDELARLQSHLSSKEPEIQRLQERCQELEQLALQKREAATSGELEQTAPTIASQDAATAPAVGTTRWISPRTEPRPPAQANADRLIESLRAQRDAALARLRSIRQNSTPKPSSQTMRREPLRQYAPPPYAYAAHETSPALASGLLPNYPPEITRHDSVLGVVFLERPPVWDDLKQINGVAVGLEKKLHALGVYTYRQMIEWSETAIEAVGERIAFKERIRKDHWVEQAHQLYQLKYGATPRAA